MVLPPTHLLFANDWGLGLKPGVGGGFWTEQPLMKFWKARRGAVWCDDDRTAGRLAGIAGRGKAESAFYTAAPTEAPALVERPERLFWTPHDLAEAQQ